MFVEFMTQQAKVRSVVVGGRPFSSNNNAPPMELVGGTRGANVYTFGTIQRFARQIVELEPNESRVAFENQTLRDWYTDLPLMRSVNGDGSINVRDLIRQGDDSQTPLQFVHQAADCRLLYQEEHATSISTLWQKVYDVAWKGQVCASGNTISEPQTSTRQTLERKVAPSVDVDVEALRGSWMMGVDLSKVPFGTGQHHPSHGGLPQAPDIY
jgi:hypothetical protein